MKKYSFEVITKAKRLVDDSISSAICTFRKASDSSMERQVVMVGNQVQEFHALVCIFSEASSDLFLHLRHVYRIRRRAEGNIDDDKL